MFRSVAFSNKQKWEQLKAKRERKRFQNSDVDKIYSTKEKSSSRTRGFDKERILPSVQPQNINQVNHNKNCLKNYYLDVEEIQGGASASNHNRYNLKFRKSKVPREETKKLVYEPVSPLPKEELEVNSEMFYPSGLDYPKRPTWKKGISKVELDKIENRSFRLFCQDIDSTYDQEELSYYELNLETWRQLWRVTEMSDIILIVVDARFVASQFPPYLYKHLVEKENKGIILVMNKCDLIPSTLVSAWMDFCKENYPKLIVVPFSSFEGKEAKKSTMKIAFESSVKLIDACQRLVDNNVDLNSWRKKVKEEMEDEESEDKCQILRERITEMEEESSSTYRRYKDNILTIGTIGHPNVGKSSLINALMGKKVVSVSKTPGHTKYFQTIFLTNNVKLCDCPGLVFPSLCPKQLQIISGCYPIAQVRDPLSTIHFIACRIDMPRILKLRASDVCDSGEEEDFLWTPFHICEAWAKNRGYFIRSRGAKPDIYRAANELLRFTLVGFKGLVISLKPIGYSKNTEVCSSDSLLNEVTLVQNLENDVRHPSIHPTSNEEFSDEEASLNTSQVDSSDEDDIDIKSNKFAVLSLSDT